MTSLRLKTSVEARPLIKPFVISTGSRIHQDVLVITLSNGSYMGRGMASGLAYRGETPDILLAQIDSVRRQIEGGLDRQALLKLPLFGGARLALDSALWELEAARTRSSVAELLKLKPQPLASAYTITLGAPDAMAEQAEEEAWRPLLKVKLGGSAAEEIDRICAVAHAAPKTRRVIDANAGWTPEQLKQLAPIAAREGYELLEQPLPMGCENDVIMRGALEMASMSIPLCADESFQTEADLDLIQGLYQAVNIKLDKCGGLTAGLRLRDLARDRGLSVFIGCMLAPSLAIAPAFFLAQSADYADLDGPFWFPDEPASLDDEGRFIPLADEVWGRGVKLSDCSEAMS